MKFVKPSTEILEQGNTLEDIWAHIARCTRVCYQSTPKNDGETDEEFVKRVILRPDSSTGRLNFDKIHGAMLEHGTVYLTLPITNVMGDEVDKAVTTIADRYKHNKYSKVVSSDKYVYVTTNLRVIYENNWLDDLEYIDTPRFHHKRVTVSFITNIGVTREFNRHRVNSMAEESTRYCNYNKRNKEHINICLPSWISEVDVFNYKLHKKEHPNIECTPLDYYILALQTCEKCYNGLIAMGWTPQQAREVLPLATKTQLIHTAFVEDWKHFFTLRADGISGPPHPNAKTVAVPLKEEFIKRGYI